MGSIYKKVLRRNNTLYEKDTDVTHSLEKLSTLLLMLITY